nr:hypothetical protein CFP56_14230 [Quercus suber]
MEVGGNEFTEITLRPLDLSDIDAFMVWATDVTRNIGNDKCRGELSYALGYKYWGKGIATKARVLEKAGFQREGVLRKYMTLKGKTRDLTMFSLLSADPQS